MVPTSRARAPGPRPAEPVPPVLCDRRGARRARVRRARRGCDSGSSNSRRSRSKTTDDVDATTAGGRAAQNAATTPRAPRPRSPSTCRARATSTWVTAPTPSCPRDKGKWCSTLVSGDASSRHRDLRRRPGRREARRRRSRSSAAAPPSSRPASRSAWPTGNVGQPSAAHPRAARRPTCSSPATSSSTRRPVSATASATSRAGADRRHRRHRRHGRYGRHRRHRWHRRRRRSSTPGGGDAQYPPRRRHRRRRTRPSTSAARSRSRARAACPNETLHGVVRRSPDRHDHRRRARATSPARSAIPKGTAPGTHLLTVQGAVCVLNATITVRRQPGVHRVVEPHRHLRARRASRPSSSAWCWSSAPAVAARECAAARPPPSRRVSFGADLDERIQLLRGIWLFSTCDDDELARIAAVAQPREAEVGDALTRQGDEGPSSS